MEDKVAWFVRKGPFADRPEDMGGDYNGYVIIPKHNPYFGSYNDVDISIHGGWTFLLMGMVLIGKKYLKSIVPVIIIYLGGIPTFWR